MAIDTTDQTSATARQPGAPSRTGCQKCDGLRFTICKCPKGSGSSGNDSSDSDNNTKDSSLGSADNSNSDNTSTSENSSSGSTTLSLKEKFRFIKLLFSPKGQTPIEALEDNVVAFETDAPMEKIASLFKSYLQRLTEIHKLEIKDLEAQGYSITSKNGSVEINIPDEKRRENFLTQLENMGISLSKPNTPQAAKSPFYNPFLRMSETPKLTPEK